MTQPVYKVEIVGSPYDEITEQLISNGVIALGGPEGSLFSLDQLLQNATQILGDDAGSGIVVDSCDSLTGRSIGGSAITPTLDTSIKIEGTASVNMGKNTDTTGAAYVHFVSSIDLVDTTTKVFMNFYIEDSATRAKLQNGSTGLTIRLDAPNSANAYKIELNPTNLDVGWNEIGGQLSSEWTSVGSPDPTDIGEKVVIFFTAAPAGTIPIGDLKMDFWHTKEFSLITVEDCDAVGFTEGGEAIAETVDTGNKKEGTGSLNLGKTAGSGTVDVLMEGCESPSGWVAGGTSLNLVAVSSPKTQGSFALRGRRGGGTGFTTLFDYSKGTGPDDATDGKVFLDLNMASQAHIDLLAFNSFRISLIKLTAPSGVIIIEVSKSDLSVGWNTIGGPIEDWTKLSGTATKEQVFASIEQLVIVGRAGGEWNIAEFVMDNWRIEFIDTAEISFSYEKTGLGPFNGGDATSSEGRLWFYVASQAAKDLLNDSEPVKISFGNASGTYTKQLNKTDLNPGEWNNLGGVFADDFELTGSDPIASIDRVKIEMKSNLASDAITLGGLKMDFWRVIDSVVGNKFAGQQIEFDHDVILNSITFRMAPVGNPIDNIKCHLMDASYNILATSINEVAISSDPTIATLNFNPYKLIASTTYVVVAFRTGDVHPDDYYSVYYQNTNVYSDGDLVKNLSGTWSVITNNDAYFQIGYIDPNLKVAQRFRLLNANSNAIEVTVFIGRVGNPIDELIAELLDDNNDVLIQSIDEISDSGLQTFNFSYPMFPATGYFFSLKRSGALDPNNYFTLEIKYGGSVYDGGILETLNDATWNEHPDDDLKFKLKRQVILAEFDMTADVKQVIFNVGKNDFGESIQRGTCDITLLNDDGKYNRDNEDSPLFGVWDFLQELRITVVHEGILYGLFTGKLIRNIPPLEFADPTIQAVLEDEFTIFDRTEVSIGNQVTKTAPQLVNALLDAANFDSNKRLIDPDTVQLKTVTWDDVDLLEKLDTIIEAGQHSHFIDADGNYVFKNNQWALDATPKYIINETNCEEATIEDDLKTILNDIRVIYNSNEAIAQDANSIGKYGVYKFILENELMPSSGIYANSMANYIKDLKKDPGSNLDFTLENFFPAVFDLTFGDKIQFINTKGGIDDIYIIQALTFDLTPGKYNVKYKARKRVGPPIVQNATVITFGLGDVWLDLNEANGTAIGQSFQLVNGGTPHSVQFNLKHDLDIARNIVVRLYAADGSGFPIGGVLAATNPVLIPAGSSSSLYNFEFTGSLPALTTGTNYVMVIDLPKTQVAIGGSEEGVINIPGFTYNTLPTGTTKISQSFTAPIDLDLASVELNTIYNTGSSSMSVTAEIFLASGDLPTGGALASKTITINGVLQETLVFEFSGGGPSLTGGLKYVVVMDTPTSIVENPSWRPFIGPDDIRSEDMCINGNLEEITQTYIHPFTSSLIQVDLQISGCSDNIVLTVGPSPTATSNPSSNGIFTFPAGQRPIIGAGVSRSLNLPIPVGCRTVGGFSIKGTKVGSTNPGVIFFRYRCAGRGFVGPIWDIDFELFGADYGGQFWQVLNNNNNGYSQGRAGYYDGTWKLAGSSQDRAFKFNYTYGVTTYEYKNFWEVWGETDNPYANGKVSEKVSGSWITKHPWDFWAQFTSVDT